MKNSNDTIGNRTRDLPACSTVRQPAAPPRTSLKDHDQALCKSIKPLNSELNPICHLLALVGAHHILHVSRIRVNKGSNKAAIPSMPNDGGLGRNMLHVCKQDSVLQ
jgi:hypothetical protein